MVRDEQLHICMIVRPGLACGHICLHKFSEAYGDKCWATLGISKEADLYSRYFLYSQSNI